MRWSLVAMGLGLLGFPPAGRAQTAPTPAPAVSPAAPASPAAVQAPPPQAPGAAPGLCETAPWDQVQPLLARTPTRGLLTGTLVLADGEGADVLMLKPLPGNPAPDDLTFRLFLATGRGDRLPDPTAQVTAFATTHAGPPSGELAAGLKLDPSAAIDMHAVLPAISGGGWSILTPWRGEVLVAVACRNGTPVAVGFRGVQESRRLPAWGLAGLLILILYLVAATMVFQSRERAVKAADEDNVTEPMRITRIQPWTWWQCLDPVVMTSDEFDRGSLSNLQVLFFGGLVAFGLTSLALRSGALSDLSPAILLLLGIPAFGSLGAGLAKNSRDRLSSQNWAWLVARGVLPANDSGNRLRPRWSDLIMTDTVLDLPKLQALTFSLIVGIAMVVTGFRDFAHFSVPTNLLGILGLSQVVFVGGRFTQPTTIGDLDDVLTDLRTRAGALLKAAASGVDVDPDGKPVKADGAAPSPAKGPYKTLGDAAANDAVPNAAQRYKDLEEQAAVLLRALFERDVRTDLLANPFAPAA